MIEAEAVHAVGGIAVVVGVEPLAGPLDVQVDGVGVVEIPVDEADARRPRC